MLRHYDCDLYLIAMQTKDAKLAVKLKLKGIRELS